MNTSDPGEYSSVRRLSPPDRRSPTKVGRDNCPVGSGCYCCPLSGERWHGNPRSNRTCEELHPPVEKLCSLPYPASLSCCPESRTLPGPPAPPAGFRPLRWEMCVECGRVTARRWRSPSGQVLPWCAGTMPTTYEPI